MTSLRKRDKKREKTTSGSGCETEETIDGTCSTGWQQTRKWLAAAAAKAQGSAKTARITKKVKGSERKRGRLSLVKNRVLHFLECTVLS